MTRWWWLVRKQLRQLWVRTTLIGLLAVATALLAAVVERYIPWKLPHFIDLQAIESLLNIIASSMLAVTTFSLGVMTSAYGSASSNVTPRATSLLLEDSTTQAVLSSFIGSFVFSIVGIIMLRFQVYGDRGRVVLFIVTILILVWIVISLLRWITYLTRFGRMSDSIGRVEAATHNALRERMESPYLGGIAWHKQELPGADWVALSANTVGYVQHIDMPALQAQAQALQAHIYVAATPGKHVFVDTPVLWVHGASPASGLTDEVRALLCNAITIDIARDFEQDPRFGLAVMCEIASRALSPATNDPGTALDVIARSTRLLSTWAQGLTDGQAMPEPEYSRIHVPPLQSADLFDDAFMLMARDGAGLVEIQLRLHKSLAALARLGDAHFQQAASEQAELALARAEKAIALPQDLARLHALVQCEGTFAHLLKHQT